MTLKNENGISYIFCIMIKLKVSFNCLVIDIQKKKFNSVIIFKHYHLNGYLNLFKCKILTSEHIFIYN